MRVYAANDVSKMSIAQSGSGAQWPGEYSSFHTAMACPYSQAGATHLDSLPTRHLPAGYAPARLQLVGVVGTESPDLVAVGLQQAPQHRPVMPHDSE